MSEYGRYFSLMSWKIREYFVMTEYLLKLHVVPLFKGLTMADDQTTLIKKMVINSGGQGYNNYEFIGIANHIDYQKWNNHQRKLSTNPVFKVVGQFFGLTNLFTRTHEFFEESIIYYKDRPDLMYVRDDHLENKTAARVCWNGQAGGLEGLRQKGWSVLDLLIIEREKKVRNTAVKILAQGDNQVICTQYKLNECRSNEELKMHIDQIVSNNNVIMKLILEGTKKLGLIINKDETLQSADMLIYGKIILYRGNIVSLIEKRLARITCTTNDQLPTMGNTLSTAATNCLTIAHYSKTSIPIVIHYNWVGNFVRNILELHNPALRCSPSQVISDPEQLTDPNYKITFLYLDPSLGEIGGLSLTRFHVRQFPDPVSESLSFWRIIYHRMNDNDLKRLCRLAGNPRLAEYNSNSFSKLLEDPTSLNIPRGISADNMLKEEIRLSLMDNLDMVKHQLIKQALTYMNAEGDRFNVFLSEITPCFPRFISEFKAATYIGLAESLVGLFQNSKTIRNVMASKFRKKVDTLILKSELCALDALFRYTDVKLMVSEMWICSATKSDELRYKSWNRKLVNTTIPHPAEMFELSKYHGSGCPLYNQQAPKRHYLTVVIPHGISNPERSRGDYSAYLGSRTSETTSLGQPWEKETIIPFIKRATKI